MKKKKSTTLKTVDELVEGWTGESGSNQHLGTIRDLVRYLSRELYEQYQPHGGKAPFWERLAGWLQNVASKRDQQLLFELVPWLLFVGRKEMEAMYQAAFVGPIARWIIDEAQLDITDANLAGKFAAEVRRTLFGSIAGMEIGTFIRINGIGGHSIRPDFLHDSQFADYDELKSKVQYQGYVRIVAVEDMVCTGTQMVDASPILAHMAPLNVLLCPIIAAPAAVVRWHNELEPTHSHFSFNPMFVIPHNATIPMHGGGCLESEHIERFRRLLTKTYRFIRDEEPNQPLYSEFGFGDFGSLVLTFLNCPDNVPPLVHCESKQWNALFPRVPKAGKE